MEVPDPRQVYNGAQRDQAGDKSDIEVVPDTKMKRRCQILV